MKREKITLHLGIRCGNFERLLAMDRIIDVAQKSHRNTKAQNFILHYGMDVQVLCSSSDNLEKNPSLSHLFELISEKTPHEKGNQNEADNKIKNEKPK